MNVIHLIIRVILIFFGVALLLFGVWDLVTPRARFVSSNPPAGAIIADPPSEVIINFSNQLAPESTMDVTSTRLLRSGETEYLDGSSVVMKSGIDPGDTGGKSMRADLRHGLHKGVYWVNWRTKSTGWRTITYGKTYFAVGMPAPENITRDMDGAIWERTHQWRSRRGALVGGLVMIALGVLLWKNK